MASLQKTKACITDTACDSLAFAAEQLQAARFPDCSVETIQAALVNWLELSIESLAEDALFHCAEGRDDIAFNRRAFRLYLDRLELGIKT